jgi:heme/copper-type cytochrome/quinol oxidase subunit 2
VSLLVLSIFWLAVALVAVSQVMILRSTVRAMRAAASAQARRGIEWAYAIVPAVALVVVLVATWQATHDHAMRADLESRANQTSPP